MLYVFRLAQLNQHSTLIRLGNFMRYLSIFLVLYFIVSSAFSQSNLRDRPTFYQEKEKADKAYEDSIATFERRRQIAMVKGRQYTCDSERFLFHDGFVWLYSNGGWTLPSAYSKKGSVVKWVSQVIGTKYELYLDDSTLYYESSSSYAKGIFSKKCILNKDWS